MGTSLKQGVFLHIICFRQFRSFFLNLHSTLPSNKGCTDTRSSPISFNNFYLHSLKQRVLHNSTFDMCRREQLKYKHKYTNTKSNTLCTMIAKAGSRNFTTAKLKTSPNHCLLSKRNGLFRFPNLLPSQELGKF